MTALAVSGYSSMDYAIGLNGQIEGGHTTLISHRDTAAWPRMGGCPSYVSVAAAGLGQKARPISWIGRDDNARKFLIDLQAESVSTNGISRIDGPSPMAVLAYQADSSCACLFDPVFAGREDLTETQCGIIAAASHICITAGPPHLTSDILAARDSDARLYWICKNDAHCFTDEIRAVLSVEADVIFCNRFERDLIKGHRADAIIV
ncbi:MAG: PfkB family carbohydrate kinase, partial [Chloroflexi bacterium]|nr:PfkB family carbohydrate kinase [Chloroflexota bacterium]